MQVACSQCGARYEFDAAAIPAAGYDAQCTACQAVFFVGPPGGGAPAASAAAPEAGREVTVACSKCGAQYQFLSSDIPAAGYDAQCSSCSHVFFVSPTGTVQRPTAAPLLGTADVASPAPAPEPEPTAEPPTPETAEFAPQTPTPSPLQAQTPVPTEVPHSPTITPGEPDVPPPPPPESAAVLDPFAGETLEPARSVPPLAEAGSDDFASKTPADPPQVRPTDYSPAVARARRERWQRRLRRLRSGAAWAVGVALALSGAVALQHYLTPARRLALYSQARQLLRPKHADTAALFARAQDALLQDTSDSLQSALHYFSESIAADTHFADAYAFRAMTHALRAADAELEMRHVDGAEMRAVRAAMARLQRKRGTGAQLAAKKREIAELGTTSRRLAALMQQESAAAQTELAQLRKDIGPTPAWARAMAIAATVGLGAHPEQLAAAQKGLGEAEKAFLGAAAGPPHDAWMLLAAASVQASSPRPEQRQSALGLLRTALSLQPTMQRARWLLAQTLVNSGQTSAARKQVEELLASAPGHFKAGLLHDTIAAQILGVRDAGEAAVEVEAAEPAPPPPHSPRPRRAARAHRRR